MSVNSSEQLRHRLHDGLQALGVSLTEQQQSTLINFIALLIKWNKVYNLTAVRDPLKILDRHIIDSLSVLPYLQGTRLIDIGAGAGIPGIPLAVAQSEKQFVLLDSNRKKTRFMQQAKTELSLANVDVVHSRVENYQPDQLFDTVISRAFASLKKMAQWSSHLVNESGVLFAMKGSYPEQEISELANSFEIKAVHKIEYPGLDADRYLVEIMLSKSQNRN
ncbi:16S rRNA (guanine(527)-N(7))-methyltransferase RsmG [Kaarinaea lacus]